MDPIDHIKTEYQGLSFPALLNVSHAGAEWLTRIITHYDTEKGAFVSNQGMTWQFAKAQVEPEPEKFVHPERLIGEVLIDASGDMVSVRRVDPTGIVYVGLETQGGTVEDLHEEGIRLVDFDSSSGESRSIRRDDKPNFATSSLKL